ncbi:MAG: RNA ligase family protein, partial [Candidatus Odinarchaeota archaeon]
MKKYQHIERLETTETEGIQIGECYIFPKIDGTCSSVWIEKIDVSAIDDKKKQVLRGELKAGSRNRELTLDNDNQGFYNWAIKQQNIYDFFADYPGYILFGEWLVPHTLKTYRNDAWRKLYIFDIINDKEKYLTYEQYKPILKQYNIDYIPPICKIKNPTKEKLFNQLEKNTFLIKDGCGSGEGIIIKNYGYTNRFGRQTWAKIVKNEFKDKFSKIDTTEIKNKRVVEDEIIQKYVTNTLIEKEFAKIKSKSGWDSKKIPQLFGVVYYCLIKEESWNFIKEFKRPVIDYKLLYNLTIQRIKEKYRKN